MVTITSCKFVPFFHVSSSPRPQAQLAALIANQRPADNDASNNASSSSKSSKSSKERKKKKAVLIIPASKGEFGRKPNEGRPAYSLEDASKLTKPLYQQLYVRKPSSQAPHFAPVQFAQTFQATVKRLTYKNLDVTMNYKDNDSFHREAVVAEVRSNATNTMPSTYYQPNTVRRFLPLVEVLPKEMDHSQDDDPDPGLYKVVLQVFRMRRSRILGSD